MMVEEATVLWMSQAIDFADWADVPLAVNTNVAKMVALKAGLRVAQVVLGKRTIY